MSRVSHKDAPMAPGRPGQPRKVNLHLAVELTPDEVAERASEAAELMSVADSAELALKDYASTERKRIGGMHVKLRSLSRQVREGVEVRQVKCEERPDFTEGKMDTYRLDTGEVAETRALLPTERQTNVIGS